MKKLLKKLTATCLLGIFLLSSVPVWASVRFEPIDLDIYSLGGYGEGKISFDIMVGEPIYTAMSPEGAISTVSGFMDTNGEVLIEPKYSYAWEFFQGYASVGEDITEYYGGGENGRTIHYLINEQGQRVESTVLLDSKGLYMRGYKDGLILCLKPRSQYEDVRYGMTDFAGNWIFPFEFEDLHLPSEGYYLAKQNGKYGYISAEEGKESLELIYEDAQDFAQGLACVKYDGLWGYIDYNGDWQIEPQYLEAQSFSEDVAAVKTASGWGVINKDNEKIIPCIYEEIAPCQEERIAVKLKGKWGYFDKTGEKVIDFKYVEARNFSEQLAIVSTDPERQYKRKYQLINQWGEQVLPQEYINIVLIDETKGALQRASDRKAFFYYLEGETAEEPEARDFIRLYLDGKYVAGDVDPLIWGEYCYLPLRSLGEALGAEIDWDADQSIAYFNLGENSIVLPLWRNFVYINGEKVEVSMANDPFIDNGRTMVPVRLISEALNFDVQWNAEKQAIYLTSKE